MIDTTAIIKAAQLWIAYVEGRSMNGGPVAVAFDEAKRAAEYLAAIQPTDEGELLDVLKLALSEEEAYERGERVFGQWKPLAVAAIAKAASAEAMSHKDRADYLRGQICRIWSMTGDRQHEIWKACNEALNNDDALLKARDKSA